MTPLQRKILIRWILVFLGVTLLFGLIAVLTFGRFSKAWIYFIGTFFLVSNLYMLLITRSVMNTQTKTAAGVLGAIVLKQLASMVFIMIYLFKFYGEDLGEIAICFATYLVYSVLAYYFGFKISK